MYNYALQTFNIMYFLYSLRERIWILLSKLLSSNVAENDITCTHCSSSRSTLLLCTCRLSVLSQLLAVIY